MPAGIFELRNPSDLLQKLRHDYERVRVNVMDSYAAMDFFLTAEHMVDWLFPKSRAARENLRSTPLLALCSHIANGAKHFEAKAPHHKWFSESETHYGAFSSEFSSDFDIRGFAIILDDAAKKEFGDRIYVQDLAEKILIFWEEKMKNEKATPA